MTRTQACGERDPGGRSSQLQDWRSSGNRLGNDSKCAIQRSSRERIKLSRGRNSPSEVNQVRPPSLVFFDAKSEGIAANAIEDRK